MLGRVDILTGTLGKALGGASGGYTSARREIVDWLRQRSRPVPVLEHAPAGRSRQRRCAVLDLVEDGDELRAQLRRNTPHFRDGMNAAGLQASSRASTRSSR